MTLENLETIAYMLTNVLSIYTVKIFFDNFLVYHRVSKRILFLTCIGVYAINSILLFVDFNTAIFAIIGLLATFGLSACYRATLKIQIIFTAFSLVLSILSEHITLYLMGSFYKMNTMMIVEQANYFIIFAALSRIVFYVLVKVMCRLFGKAKNVEIPISYWLAIFIIPAGSIFVIYLIDELGYSSSNPLNIFSAIAVVVLLLINFLVFFLYEQILSFSRIKTQNAMLSLQNDYYAKQYQIMKDADEETRRLRHDLHGHLSAIKTYADNGDIGEINCYIGSLLGKTEYAGTYSSCGILAIDGVINLKMNEAAKLGAKIGVTVNVPGDLEINPVDMTVILSNILDNAVEACQHVEPGERFINIRMEYEKKNMFMTVENSCDDTLTVKSKNGLITTKQNMDGEIHGLGLDNVRSVVKKYDGTVTVDKEPQKFICSILLYSIEHPK